jgi:hypothetical protein
MGAWENDPASSQLLDGLLENTNRNGIQDAGDSGISGVDVVITDSWGASQTLTTDSTGMYMAEFPVGPAVTDIVIALCLLDMCRLEEPIQRLLMFQLAALLLTATASSQLARSRALFTKT